MNDSNEHRSGGIGKRVLLIAGLLMLLVAIAFIAVLVRGSVQRTALPTPDPADFQMERAMDLWFLDVGQGDAILVRLPNGKTLLVDTGPSEARTDLLNELDAAGVAQIDCLVLTHAHRDHTDNAVAVIKHIPVARVIMPDGASEEGYGKLFPVLKEERIPFETVQGSMTNTIDLDDAIEIRILSPLAVQYDEENERSVLLHLRYENTAVLLTGDAGALTERLMLKAYPNQLLTASVLKLGHHGSYSSTTEKFLQAVKPGLAIASCGKNNSYGHPDEGVVALLNEYGIPLLTTAQQGTIHLLLDGLRVQVVE